MEIWKDITGFEGSYQVSNFGRVKSLARKVFIQPNCQQPNGHYRPIKERILKPSRIMGNGKVRALSVTLWENRVSIQESVHALVLKAFSGPRPDGMYGYHTDDTPINNMSTNLYWGTPTQNCADKIRHGNQQRGAEIPWSKLKDADVREIRRQAGHTTQSDLAETFGVGQPQISRIVHRHEWSHLS